MGIEPTTSTLGRWHSTAELRPRKIKIKDKDKDKDREIGYLSLEMLQVMMNPLN